MNENAPARRAEDKRADGAVDWTDAPRFTALGIAEKWSVTVEAEGQRVVYISDDHVQSLDGDRLGQFFPTIRSCAQHLLGFIGTAPISITAGAAQGGIASLEGLETYNASRKNLGAMQRVERGNWLRRTDVERLLATTAGEQAEPADLHNAIMNLRCKVPRALSMNGASEQAYQEGHRDARRAAAEIAIASQAAPAAPEQVQADLDALGWPNEIYLNAGDDEISRFDEYSDVSWCSLPQGTNDIRYVRADVEPAPSTAQVQAIPAGYKLVPIEPTEQMREAAASFGHPDDTSYPDGYSAQRGNEAVESYRHMIEAAPIAAAPAAPTDVSQRLRVTLANCGPDARLEPLRADILAAAEEIERYYGGMMAWKRTAEKKDRDWNAERMARDNERCAARAAATAAPEQDEVRERQECWSANEEDFNATSLDQLLNENEHLKPGDTVWVGVAAHPDPKRLVNEDGIIENIGEAAYDIGGEHAEDYPDVTPDQAKELEALVADWIKRTCPPTFWTVEDVKPYVLSYEDFPHDPAPVELAEPGAMKTATNEGERDAS